MHLSPRFFSKTSSRKRLKFQLPGSTLHDSCSEHKITSLLLHWKHCVGSSWEAVTMEPKLSHFLLSLPRVQQCCAAVLLFVRAAKNPLCCPCWPLGVPGRRAAGRSSALPWRKGLGLVTNTGLLPKASLWLCVIKHLRVLLPYFPTLLQTHQAWPCITLWRAVLCQDLWKTVPLHCMSALGNSAAFFCCFFLFFFFFLSIP